MTTTKRVFISSTAEDLRRHRQSVLEVIDRLGYQAVHMETFGAIPTWSLQACRELVRDCDALVVIVAYRYGWIPSVEQGGDGKKSVTWLEVQEAMTTGVPVFAFLVDDKALWTEHREEENLVRARDEDEVRRIGEAVHHLVEFKASLSNQPVAFFSTPEDLAMKVSASLASWFGRAGRPFVSQGFWFHPGLGLAIPAPHGWAMTELMGQSILIRPREQRGFTDNLNVQTVPLSRDLGLSDVMEGSVAQLQALESVTIEAAERRMIDDRPVAYFRYHGLLPGQADPLHYVCCIYIRGDQQVVVTATAGPEHWAETSAIVESMVNGLRFTRSVPPATSSTT